MNSLFQRFWIIKTTSAIRRVITNCTHCRLQYAKPNQQLMAYRLQVDSHPFTYCGVDYFGPLVIRQKRSNIKRYGCLFTCLTTRAVHLEVATDLSADAFINALRRFLSRRGPVICMYSDNGTNLVGVERMLHEALQKWNEHQVQEFLLQKEIRWSFNPPSASHMGGVWERMIRSVRRILISLTSQRNLSDDQLHTFLLEAESILNSRPLSPVILDIDEQKPLTPNHLLKLHPTQELPPVLTSKEDCYAKCRWLYVQFLADQFWRRFSSEYFRMIISRQKWHKTKPNLKPGDVVLIVDESTPRSQWNLGKVASVCPDKYGIVRNVTVDVRGREIRCPIHKLCLIVPKEDKIPTEELTSADSVADELSQQ